MSDEIEHAQDCDTRIIRSRVKPCTCGAFIINYRLRYGAYAAYLTAWTHCGPDVLAAGVHCPSAPRRPCACPVDGSHDHLVSAVFLAEKGIQ